MQKDKYEDDIFDILQQDNTLYSQVPKPGQTENLFQYRYKDDLSEMDSEKLSQKHQVTLKSQSIRYSPFSSQQMRNYIQKVGSQRRPSKSQDLQNRSSSKFKKNRNKKQKAYSKVYRQKMKQKYQFLQEQNDFLKKRIFELQSQIRQQEIQLNRFRFHPPEKELSIEELNKQFTDLSVDYLEQLKKKPGEYQKQWFLNQSYYHKFFQDFYAERGFAGRKKLKILNYHFNQYLQTVLKDTEKYLSLTYFNSEDYDRLNPLPQFEVINNAYSEIFKPQGDLWHRLKTFNKFLKPMSLQLNRKISVIHKQYEDILKCCYQIHNFIRQNYLINMDIGRRRLQMESWFDHHKYSKVMRKLRYTWFNWMKSLAQKQDQEIDQMKRGTKRKKPE